MDFRRLLVFSTCFLVAVLGCTLSTVRATGEQEENGPNAEESLGLARNRPSRDEDEVMEEGTFKLSDTKDGELIDGLMTTDGRTIDPEEFGATFDTVILPYDELCFFQPAKKGVNLHVEFHVVGNAKYSDIDMSVTDPTGRVVLEELRSRGNMEGEHNELHNDEDHEDSLVKVRESGDYKVCFGNKQTVSPSFQKRLHLDIGPMLNIKFKNSRKDDLPEEQTERIFESLENCLLGLDLVAEVQQLRRRTHKSDMLLLYENDFLIVFRSIVIIIIMCISVGVQTFLIRTLFKNS